MCFFEGGDLKDSAGLTFERCEHRDGTFIADGGQECVKC